MRSCQLTQHQPFYGHLAFEANWKGEKSQQVSVSQADQKRKKKKAVLMCLLFSYLTTMNHLLIVL